MSREYGPKKAVLNRIAYVAATWMLRSTSLRYVALQRVVKMSQRVVFLQRVLIRVVRIIASGKNVVK